MAGKSGERTFAAGKEHAMSMAMVTKIAYPEAVVRVRQVLEAIVASTEWKHYSGTFATMAWIDTRDQFRSFFDKFEGQSGEEWLGVAEWAVLEEMRLYSDRIDT
ncbi:MAG: hypothetical protein P8Y48_09165, partial [Novosphingobium sp.]